MLVGAAGCASYGPTATERVGVETTQAWRLAAAAPVASTQPATVTQADQTPDDQAGAGAAVTLNIENIVQGVFEASPSVRASREEKEAAKHQLDEFRANLSRFEPFVEANSSISDFPERRDSEGATGEVVGGVEKEMFDGARIRAEGGGSASRFEFGEVEEGQDDVEKGSGGLLRASIEVPFVGSRRRQERVISQAFQESTARKAELMYLSNYRAYVSTALSYYSSMLLYKNYMRAYEKQSVALASLLEDARIRDDDRTRVESTEASGSVLRNRYGASYQQQMTSLLATLGLPHDTVCEVEEPEYAPSPYMKRASTPEGMRALMNEAYHNNPTFGVLNDAIRNAEIQRAQAIAGTLDLTVFGEGTQFAFGSETFDDRVRGWEISGGVRLRLNDQRVLKATRLKAEAQIRQFEAQIEVERRTIERDIVTHTNRLRANHHNRSQILDVIRQKQADFDDRLKRYLEDPATELTIDDVLLPLSELRSARIRLGSNEYYSLYAGTQLMTATGEVYRMVGMEINGSDVSSEAGAE